jgi:two-component system, cell cycle response regulator
MLLSRDELITALFEETDRAQRLKTGLAVILCGIDGGAELHSELDAHILPEVDQEIARRMVRALRCYDSLGRFADGEYCLVLPGCNSFNAVVMAERLGQALFSSPIHAGGESVSLRANFGIAGSGGRSPLVVLRNAENALRNARLRGPGSIERSCYDAEPDPTAFPIAMADDKSLRW